MIFLYEPQNTIPPECLDNNKILFPLSEACKQYKFLYMLELNLIKTIDEIHCIYKKGFDARLYKEKFSEYSSEISKYPIKYVLEIGNFPEPSEIIDLNKKSIIERLIHNEMFTELQNTDNFINTNFSGKEILIYLPFKKELCDSIILKCLDRGNLRLFSCYNEMKVKGSSKIVEIDKDVYLGIMDKLQKIEDELATNDIPQPYEYMPQSILEIFNDDLTDKLSFVNKNDLRKLKVIGQEKLLADRIITHILKTLPSVYDLQLGIPRSIPEDTPLVFANFDMIDNPVEYRNLYDSTKRIDAYIIMLLKRQKFINFFSDYFDIEIPDRASIEKVLTSIFIALLVERGKLDSTYYYKLMLLISNNSFSTLLSEFNNLNDMSDVFSKLQEISTDDLLHKAEMWYFIVTELKKRKEGNKIVLETAEKKEIIFEFENKSWNIYGFEKPFNCQTKGMNYIAIIIYHQKLYGRPIDITVLDKIVNDLVDKPSKEKDLENCRLAILGTLTTVYESYPVMKDFCDKYIKYEKYQYCFIPNDIIECEVNYPKLTKSIKAIFDSLYKK